MKLTTVSTAVVLLYTAPIGVMIFSVLFLGERFTGKKCIALVCMMIGCFLVSVVGSLSFQAMGVLLGILSGIFYSTYSIFSKIEMRKGSDPVTATFYCFVFASLIGSVVCHTGDIPKLVLSDSVGILLVILLMGLCTAVLPYVLYSIGLKYLPAGTASALAIVEPLSATIFGITLLDEPITGASAGGMLLIFGSIYLLSRNDRHL